MTQRVKKGEDSMAAGERNCFNNIKSYASVSQVKSFPVALLFFFLLSVFFSSPRLHRPPRRRRPFGPWHRGRLHRPPASKESQSN